MLRFLGFAGGFLAMAAIAASGYAYFATAGQAVADYDGALSRYESLQCVGDQILSAVPEDATFIVAEIPQGLDSLWRQWLTEIASPERRVVLEPSRADFVVRLTTSPARAVCDGYGVDIVSTTS